LNLPLYLNHVLRHGTTRNGVFGTKLHYYQFVDLPTRLAAAEKYRNLSIAQVMAESFPNLQYLWLTRHDKARQAISFYRAYSTGAWWQIDGRPRGEREPISEAVEFDADAIFRLEQALIQNDVGWQLYFEANGIAPLLVDYEDLQADYKGTIHRALKWLDIRNADSIRIPEPRLSRQADSVTDEWLVDYLEFKEETAANVETALRRSDVSIPIFSPLLALSRKGRELARVPRRPFKVLALLKVLQELEGLNSSAKTIPRVSRLGRKEFREHHYSRNRPAIITGSINNWPATSLWSPQYLKQKVGNVPVRMDVIRRAGESGPMTARKDRGTMEFSEGIDRVFNGIPTETFRLRVDSRFFKRPGARELTKDIGLLDEYLDREAMATGSPSFEVESAGHVMPLHHDPCNRLIAQVVGRRHFNLIPATHWQYLYNESGTSSPVDCEHPDFARWPLFRHATVITIDLQPGDVLFMPVGWWYQTRSVDASVAMAFTNFVYPNEYEWPNQRVTRATTP
jgi:LPS sulfotransferase NodH